MLGPTRALPRIGGAVKITHFGGGVEAATVVAVHDEGRRLRVRGQDGEEHEFALSPKTARFVAAADPHGPRLELLG